MLLIHEKIFLQDRLKNMTLGNFFLTFMNGNKNLFEENRMNIRPQFFFFSFLPF